MNLSIESAPRLTCRVVRGWIAIFGNETSALRNSHVCGCPDCQAYFAGADDFDLELRREASRERAEPPSALEANILRAVRQATPPARGSFLPFLSLSGVAAAIAAAVVVLQSNQPDTSPDSGLATATIEPAELTAAGKFATASPAELLSNIQPQAEAIMRQEPLQNELDAVVSSARGAVRFLTRNFVPSDAMPATSRSSG